MKHGQVGGQGVEDTPGIEPKRWTGLTLTLTDGYYFEIQA